MGGGGGGLGTGGRGGRIIPRINVFQVHIEAAYAVQEEKPMRSKARGLVQHGGPPGWLEGVGQSMPPALSDHTTLQMKGR